ncbi:MAG: hypothetical protein V4568_11715 [Pseudomonadota bacterium]
MLIFYMNRGKTGSNTVDWRRYDALLFAESNEDMSKYFTVSKSSGTPPLTIYEKTSESLHSARVDASSSSSASTHKMSLRNVTEATDIDTTAQSTRPLFKFQLTGLPSVNVVFVHLKSGNKKIADEEIVGAVNEMNKIQNEGKPTLWVGDFNRAEAKDLTLIYNGGGQANWYLDRVYVSNWDKKNKCDVKCVSRNIFDHHHEGLEIDVEYKY